MMSSKWKSRRCAPSDGSYAIHVDLQKGHADGALEYGLGAVYDNRKSACAPKADAPEGSELRNAVSAAKSVFSTVAERSTDSIYNLEVLFALSGVDSVAAGIVLVLQSNSEGKNAKAHCAAV